MTLRWMWRLCLALLVALPLAARGDLAPQVSMATPGSNGAMSGAVDRFTLRFTEAMVALGDPRATAPATTDCPGAGAGHGVDAQTGVVEFAPATVDGTSFLCPLRAVTIAVSLSKLGDYNAFYEDFAFHANEDIRPVMHVADVFFGNYRPGEWKPPAVSNPAFLEAAIRAGGERVNA